MHTLLIAPSRQPAILEQLQVLMSTRKGYEPLEFVLLDRAEARWKATGELAIIVLVPEHAVRTLSVIQRLRAAGTGHILIVGPATDPKLILQTMQAGGDFFVDQDELEVNLDAALDRLLPTPEGGGELIAVLGASGGCGASTVATNLAVVLAGAHGRCNLLDLNTRRADLAPLLDLKPQYTLTDLCRREERLDSSMYERLLTPHESGVSLLAGPRGYDESGAFTAGGVEQAVGLARATFQHVVVDLEDCFHQEQLAVLAQATRVLLVCRLDFTAVRNAQRVLGHLAARGVAGDRVTVVFNRTGRPDDLSLADAQAALNVASSYQIPDTPEAVSCATNTGVPVAAKAPLSAFAQSVAGLVGLAAPVPPGPDFWHRASAWVRTRALPRVRSAWQNLVRSLRPASAAPVPAPEGAVSHALAALTAAPLPRMAIFPSEEVTSHALAVPAQPGPDSRACAV